MLASFITIRLKQILRGLYGLGILRLIFLVGLLSFSEFILFKQTALYPNTTYILGLYLAFLTLIQIKRSDLTFLKTHFLNYKTFIFIEYLLLSLPLLFCFIFYYQFESILILIASIYGITHLNITIQKKSYNNQLLKWIPMTAFEWKAGFRQYQFILIPLWITAVLSSFFMGSVPIAIFIIGVIPLNFFEKGEPIPMIIAFEMDTKSFLWSKIKTQILIYSCIVVPLILISLVFHLEYWYIPVTEFIIFLFLNIYFILTKYAFYEPNKKSPAATTFGGLGTVSALIPFFLPVIILLSIWFYIKSTKKLNLLLHDFNK